MVNMEQLNDGHNLILKGSLKEVGDYLYYLVERFGGDTPLAKILR